MKLGSLVRGVAAAMTCLTATLASAQTVITRWNFNNAATLTVPSTGSGTLTQIGGTLGTSVSGTGSSDGGSALNATPFPAQSVGSGTAGVQFAVSTANNTSIIVSTDMRWSGSCSKYVRAQYSTNGTTFVDMPSDSLITAPGNTNFVNGLTWDLSGVAAANNNANFKVRFVTIFDPANNATYSTNTGVAYATTGTLRFDAVTVKGTALVPVPPMGTGTANPSVACRGFPVKFSVSTTAGQNPPSDAVVVNANLSSLGGSANQSFTETSTGIFEYTLVVPVGQGLGAYMIPFTVSETNASPRSSNGNFSITVNQCINTADVVISQVYGGGGNFPDAIYKQDFVELYNRSAMAVNIGGWSVQYATATGGFTQKVDVPAATTLQPGQYYLVQMGLGSAGSQDLPTADLIGTINMSATNGKVALATNNTLLGSACIGPTVSDLVAYGVSAGSVSCFEGLTGPALGMSNSNAVIRLNNGCTDTNSNIDDFATGTPTPRTTAFTANTCGSEMSASGFYSGSVYCPGDAYQITLSVSGGTGTYQVFADLSPVGGSANQAMNDLGGGSFGFSGTVDTASTIRRFITQVRAIDNAGHSTAASVAGEVGRCQPGATSSSDPRALCVNRNDTYRLVVFPLLANANPPSLGVMSIVADFSSVGGPASVMLADDGTGVWTSGHESLMGGAGTGDYMVPYLLTDFENRTFSGNATVSVIDCSNAARGMKISQVYGAGNNSGTPASSYDRDYVELFNSSSSAIDITGWGLQYTSVDGPNTTPAWAVVPLSGVVQPGGYYLVSLVGGGTAGGAALPPADAQSSTVAISPSGGKLALTNDQTALVTSTDCALGNVVDQVSYGPTATCYEGHGSAGGHNNTRALFRIDGGCRDTNNNDADLVTYAASPRNSSSPTNPCASTCTLDYNNDTVINPDDLGDFITDYYTDPPPPGPDGYAIPCPGNDPPYNAGYKTAFTIGNVGQCNPPFSDNLGDWITQYFGDQTCG